MKKLHKTKFYLPENSILNTSSIISHYIKDQQKKEEDLFIHSLKTMAEPPIKGEITKGKLKWRGIKLIYLNEGLKQTKWLEQRGKQISPKIVITGIIKE